jgi:hypothetical protein
MVHCLDEIKPLLLLDLNGTLCYRTELRVPDIKVDLYVRRKFVYLRPDVNEFLSKLSPFFNVCLYTSVMRHNAQAVLDLLQQKDIAMLFDREYCKPDPNGKEAWDTIRDMEKIFKAAPGFSLKNTILVDNETRKFESCIDNGILVSEFGMAQVLQKQCALGELADYLVVLGKKYRESHFDVREYMESVSLKSIHGSSTLSKVTFDLAQEMDKVTLIDKVKAPVTDETTKAPEKEKEITDEPAKSHKEPVMKKIDGAMVKTYLEKFAGLSMYFKRLSNSGMEYAAFGGMHVSFNVVDDVAVTDKMSLANLWKSIEKGSPKMMVDADSKDLKLE